VGTVDMHQFRHLLREFTICCVVTLMWIALVLVGSGCSTRIDDPGNDLIAYAGSAQASESIDSFVEHVCSEIRKQHANGDDQRLTSLYQFLARGGIQGENYPDEVLDAGQTRNLVVTSIVSSPDKIAEHATRRKYVVRMVRESQRWRICDAREATQSDLDAAESRRRALEETGDR
jgi:hypothetical protein